MVVDGWSKRLTRREGTGHEVTRCGWQPCTLVLSLARGWIGARAVALTLALYACMLDECLEFWLMNCPLQQCTYMILFKCMLNLK